MKQIISPLLLIISVTYIQCNTLKAQTTELTAQELIALIKEEVNCEWQKETVDTFKAGDPATKVAGIATTFMATMEVLKKAKAQGCNLVITHEPTFYNHLDDMEPLERDPVQQAKLSFIEDNDMVVFRFHDHWHRHRPDGIYTGVIQAFGWEKYREGMEHKFIIPKTTLKELGYFIAQKFGTHTVRVVGNPDMELTYVGMVLGAAGRQRHLEMLNKRGIQAIIVGESQEWETVEYVRDANELGMEQGLIVMGHADSEEAGMAYCAEWLESFITKDIPVKFISAGNPLWSPEQFK